ncbi:MAG: hypothetical protein Q9170_006111 [Blastenia crenularia]
MKARWLSMVFLPFSSFLSCILAIPQLIVPSNNIPPSIEHRLVDLKSFEENVCADTFSSVSNLNTSVTADPPIPRIPGFEMNFTFDKSKPLRAFEIYQTAIQMMYDFAQRAWGQIVLAFDSKQFNNYNVLILFINTQPPTAPDQLQVMHCVAALYRAIVAMTDGVLFYELRSQLGMHSANIGGLSITPIDDPRIRATEPSGTSLEDDAKDVSIEKDIDSVSDMAKGEIEDPIYPSFGIKFQFLGKSIQSKEVSMAILEALTAAAPHPVIQGCQELWVSSPDGGCAIFIESVHSVHPFTYQWATRALILLFQKIIVPQKNFGDIHLELSFRGHIFGDLRMIRTVAGKNSTGLLASER